MSFKSQAMIFAAGFVVCLAVLLPFVFRFNQPDVSTKEETILRPASPPVTPQGPPGSKSDFRSATPSKKGWATTLAPLYTIGIFLYLIYIVHRILSHKKNNANNRAVELRKKRKSRISNLPASRLHQLEKDVEASQKAVEDILQKAHLAMSKAYEEASSDSSLRDSSGSDNSEAKVVELSQGTTSSANNDSHQDSSSSLSEKVALHRRKTHHRRKQSFTDESSTSSNDEKEDIYHRTEFITESSSSVLDEEDTSPSHLESSESGSSLDDSSTVAFKSPSVSTLPYIGDSNRKPKKATSVEDLNNPGSDKTLDKLLAAEGTTKKTSPKSRKEAENQRLLEDKEKLRQTTREVLTAVEEIKDFIKHEKK